VGADGAEPGVVTDADGIETPMKYGWRQKRQKAQSNSVVQIPVAASKDHAATGHLIVAYRRGNRNRFRG
jgi:hypothetical protein